MKDLTVNFTDDAFKVISLAIKQAKKECPTGKKNIPDALEYICLNFLLKKEGK